ncbi:MAG: alpha/beta hydrolase [Pseudorhodoferax sp.]
MTPFVHRFGTPGNPPLLLVHGFTDDGTNWPDAVERWRADWDIHAVDLRGHGRSPRFTPENVADGRTLWVEDVRAVAASLDRPPVVVGHSLGGFVALRLAERAPELVRALVLEDPAQPVPGPGPDPRFVAAQREFLSAFPSRTESEIARMRRETPWSEAEIVAWAASKPHVDPLMVEQGLFLGNGPWEDAFLRLTMPTLLVLPEDGGMGPDARAYGNPLLESVRIAGAGHCVRRDQPVRYHAAVDAFLARL